MEETIYLIIFLGVCFVLLGIFGLFLKILQTMQGEIDK